MPKAGEMKEYVRRRQKKIKEYVRRRLAKNAFSLKDLRFQGPLFPEIFACGAQNQWGLPWGLGTGNSQTTHFFWAASNIKNCNSQTTHFFSPKISEN